MEVNIPDKLAFKKKEVSNITKLDGKVIDYWEAEFNIYKPLLNKKGEKFYTKHDIELILRIKELLVVKKITKAEVKEIFKKEILNIDVADSNAGKSVINDISGLDSIKKGLLDILTLLAKNDKN